MDDDDIPVGRILSRREALRLLTAAGTVMLTGCAAEGAGSVRSAELGGAARASASGGAPLPACVVKPELTIGPYFVGDRPERSDIRVEPSTGEVKEGLPVELTFNVSEISNGACTPFARCLVDVWQCDALGAYSGVTDRMQGFATEGESFLRGYQRTDERGTARFVTIFPGWYRGRAVHIHFRIRTSPEAEQDYDFTSQLFFDDELIDEVHARAPYAAKGMRDQRNPSDGIYRQSGGQLLLSPTPTSTGLSAVFAIGLDMSDAAAGAPDDQGRRGPGGGGAPRGAGARPDGAREG